MVTGCCGFIGSNVSQFLINNNYKVLGLDNLLTGSISNIKHLINNKNFDFYEYDICNPIAIDFKIDKIMHFASPASPSDYLKYPIKTLQIGSYGTENMLKYALEKNASILLSSTSEVYGDPLEHPQSEEYYGNVNPIGERSVYDEAKRYLEAITIAYKKKYRLDVKIARLFNTYGPNMRVNDGRAIPNFINQALNNSEISIYGTGSQTRSFCYIDDTVTGLYKLLNSNYNKPVNIGNPNEYTILELAKIVCKMTNSTSKLSFYNLPEDDPKVRQPNIDLAKDLLGWEPKIELKTGLERTIKYFKKVKI